MSPLPWVPRPLPYSCAARKGKGDGKWCSIRTVTASRRKVTCTSRLSSIRAPKPRVWRGAFSEGDALHGSTVGEGGLRTVGLLSVQLPGAAEPGGYGGTSADAPIRRHEPPAATHEARVKTSRTRITAVRGNRLSESISCGNLPDVLTSFSRIRPDEPMMISAREGLQRNLSQIGWVQVRTPQEMAAD